MSSERQEFTTCLASGIVHGLEPIADFTDDPLVKEVMGELYKLMSRLDPEESELQKARLGPGYFEGETEAGLAVIEREVYRSDDEDDDSKPDGKDDSDWVDDDQALALVLAMSSIADDE